MKKLFTLFVMSLVLTTAQAQRRMLLLVDCQYDFINGSLAVAGAPAKMDALAEYIKRQPSGTFAQIVMTADFHPYNHSSFKAQGGLWPVHCQQFAHGGAIYQPVLDAVNAAGAPATVLTKGEKQAVDEYSIMANAESAARLLAIIKSENIDEIFVAGLCGDYCVGNTIKDLAKAGYAKQLRVLTEYIGNIDDGTTLRGIVGELEIKN